MCELISKQLLGISIAATLIFTATGCGSSSTTTKTSRQALPESIQNLSFDEHLNISVGYWNIEEMEKAAEPDAMTQYIEDLFNITLEPVAVTWSNYKERYQILSATGSLPDVFATLTLSSNDNNDSATFSDFINTGVIRALPEDLTDYPRLNEILDSVSYTRYTDGKYYAIPRVSFLDPVLGATDAAMLVRRDWMDSLGISNPENFQDFADMTIAFAKNDPDGNGIDDTLGYNVNSINALGKWVILGIAPECNVYSWTENNGFYVPSWSTDAFKQVVKDYRLLYEEGGLDPDFYTKSPSAVMDDFAAGRLGALEYKSSLLDTKGESLTTALARKYPSSILFSGIATWGGSWKDFEVNDMNTLRYGKFATILASESANYCKEHTTQVSRPYAFMSYPKEPTEEFSTSNAFKQFISCIIGNDDAVDMWENVLKQMRSDGLDEYIQRQNENFAKSQN